MQWVYILYSPALNRYYIGETSDPEQRLAQHRTGFYKGSYTTRATDWTMVLSFAVPDRAAARQVESFLKRMRNRAFLERFITDPTYRTGLLRDRFAL